MPYVAAYTTSKLSFDGSVAIFQIKSKLESKPLVLVAVTDKESQLRPPSTDL